MRSLLDNPRRVLAPELREKLDFQVRRSLTGRLLHGFYVYPPLLLLLLYRSSYHRDFPLLVEFMVASVLLGLAIRLSISVWGEKIYLRSPTLWVAGNLCTTVLTAGTTGGLLTHSLQHYGVSNWNFMLLMMWTTGVATGAAMVFTPSFRFFFVHLSLTILPAFTYSLVMRDQHAGDFTLASGLLYAFLLITGRMNYLNYWRQAIGRVSDSERAMALEKAQFSADAANRAKSDFLANMSHEIRTPMHGVLGMAELALSCNLASEPREYVQTLRNSAQSLLQVLNDILDLSKIEAGRIEVEARPFSPAQILNEAYRTFSAQAELKGIRLLCEFRGLGETVLGDAFRIRQILLNLVGNAVKFTETGEVRMTLEVTRPADGTRQLWFEVADTGPGIAADKLDLIFESFSQADVSITRRFGGTGLGLSISSRLAALMGGRLSVESGVGSGSRFVFLITLPVDVGFPQLRHTPLDRAAPIPNALRILLAEDNPVNQKVALAMLMRLGHDVEVVSNGQECIEKFEHGEFDAILMDSHMPVLDGVEAAVQIRKREWEGKRRRTPIIALTASAMAGDRERLLASGMDDYLAKPFLPAELAAVLPHYASTTATAKPS